MQVLYGVYANPVIKFLQFKIQAMQLKNYMRLLVAGSFMIAIASCGVNNQEKMKMPAPEVNIIVAGQETVPVYAEYIGQTSGDADIKILPRVQGLVTGIFFRDGQWVEKGDLLYTIDDLTVRTQISDYRASVAKAVTVMTNKKSNLERVKPLADMNALSKHDLDAAQADYEAAKSDVAAAQAQLADVNIQLGYTHIKAPVSGLMGISNVRVGDYAGGPGSAVLNTLSSTSGIKVMFPVSESDYLKFIKRMTSDSAYNRQITQLPVDLILADGTVYNQKGRLVLADGQVNPATGSLMVEADFPNPQKILRPGQYARIRFQSDEHKNAVMVPQQAVNQLQDIYQVYILNDSNKIVPHTVKPGIRIGSNWIIDDGLKPGDKVAVIGNAFINPQLPVKPKIVTWNYQQNKAN